MYLLATMLHICASNGSRSSAEHGQRREAEHRQTESGKKWDLLAEGHGSQSNEKDQDSKRNPVGVKRKKIRRPEQENGHRGHIKDGGKSQSQMKGRSSRPATRQSGLSSLSRVKARASAAHGLDAHTELRLLPARTTRELCRRGCAGPERRLQFSM